MGFDGVCLCAVVSPVVVILLSVCGVAAVLLLCLCVCLCKCLICTDGEFRHIHSTTAHSLPSNNMEFLSLATFVHMLQTTNNQVIPLWWFSRGICAGRCWCNSFLHGDRTFSVFFLAACCGGQVLSASCHRSDYDEVFSHGFMNRKHPGTFKNVSCPKLLLIFIFLDEQRFTWGNSSHRTVNAAAPSSLRRFSAHCFTALDFTVVSVSMGGVDRV